MKYIFFPNRMDSVKVRDPSCGAKFLIRGVHLLDRAANRLDFCWIGSPEPNLCTKLELSWFDNNILRSFIRFPCTTELALLL